LSPARTPCSVKVQNWLKAHHAFSSNMLYFF
jgi:hypothetical protein